MRQVIETLRGHHRPFRYAAGLVLARTGLCRFFWIHHRDFKLRFRPTSLSLAMWIDPDARADDHDFFRAYLRPGDVVIDVGANIGTLTLTAAVCVGAVGSVHAVEPHPTTAAVLRENVRDNRALNVEIHNVALGSVDGTVRLADVEDDSANFVGDGGAIVVPLRRLDSLRLGGERRVALLKIDVEGFEREVLLGGAETLKRSDCVYFEAFERLFQRYGYRTRDVVGLLAHAGFAVYRRSGPDALAPVDANFDAEELHNLVAARDAAELVRRTGMTIVR